MLSSQFWQCVPMLKLLIEKSVSLKNESMFVTVLLAYQSKHLNFICFFKHDNKV